MATAERGGRPAASPRGAKTATAGPAVADGAAGGPPGLPRLLPVVPAVTLADHLRIFGRRPAGQPALIDEIGRAGLRGRGGASFPTAVKLGAVAAGRRPIVLANGTEGEPLSAKDKTLLTYAPHLVLDGAVLAAEAVGASDVVVGIDRTAPSSTRWGA